MKQPANYFLIGIGIGCGVTLLLMSRAGQKMRAQVQNQTARGAAYVQESAANLRDQAFDLARKGAEGITNQTSALAAGLDAGRRAYVKSVTS
jgi:hypothetical protein